MLHFAWFINNAQDMWRGGAEGAYVVSGVSQGQFWIERFGLWFSADFKIQVPHPTSVITSYACGACKKYVSLGYFMMSEDSNH